MLLKKRYSEVKIHLYNNLIYLSFFYSFALTIVRKKYYECLKYFYKKYVENKYNLTQGLRLIKTSKYFYNVIWLFNKVINL